MILYLRTSSVTVITLEIEGVAVTESAIDRITNLVRGWRTSCKRIISSEQHFSLLAEFQPTAYANQPRFALISIGM